ncbi:MAG: AEC family transporter [Schleiferiaceae bacterium]|nr:AEC family transporter [Schleiferiaceae bacterium]
MENFILIIVCLLVGMTLKRHPKFPEDAHLGINAFIVFVCLPAVVLKYVPTITFSTAIIMPFAASWMVWFGAFALFTAIAKWKKWPRDLTVALILLSGLGNTSFVGFPLVTAWYGAENISIALFADQGAFLVMATLGVGIATRTQSEHFDILSTLKNLLKFPPFVAFLLAIPLNFLTLPPQWFFVADHLAAPLVPLALVSVGLQINFNERFTDWRYLSLGLLYKLILAPLLVFLLFRIVLQDGTLYSEIAVFESAMAPMVTAFIIASQYGLRPKLAGMLVGIGIPVSLFTTAAWYYVLQIF